MNPFHSKLIYDLIIKDEDKSGDIWMMIECCIEDKKLIGQSITDDVEDLTKRLSSTFSNKEETIEIAKKKLKDFNIVGSGTEFIFGPLKRLNTELTEEEANILKFGPSKASTAKKISTIIKIVLIQAIRQGSIAIDEILIPFSKIIIKALATAAGWVALTTVVGAIGGAGIGSIPGFIGGVATSFIGGLPLTIISALPVLVKGTISLIKEIFRKDNPLKGVPLILPIIPVLGVDPLSISLAALGGLPTIMVVAGPLLVKLFYNYIKNRRKDPAPKPKTNQDVKSEIIAAISEIPVSEVPKDEIVITKTSDLELIGKKLSMFQREELYSLTTTKLHENYMDYQYAIITRNNNNKNIEKGIFFNYNDKNAEYMILDRTKKEKGYINHINNKLLENIDKLLLKKYDPFHIGILMAMEYCKNKDTLSVSKMIIDTVMKLK